MKVTPSSWLALTPSGYSVPPAEGADVAFVGRIGLAAGQGGLRHQDGPLLAVAGGQVNGFLAAGEGVFSEDHRHLIIKAHEAGGDVGGGGGHVAEEVELQGQTYHDIGDGAGEEGAVIFQRADVFAIAGPDDLVADGIVDAARGGVHVHLGAVVAFHFFRFSELSLL